jgi:hypothetical protein
MRVCYQPYLRLCELRSQSDRRYVIDTGIEVEHPEFGGRMYEPFGLRDTR